LGCDLTPHEYQDGIFLGLGSMLQLKVFVIILSTAATELAVA
jgi:hypothetical protein